MNLSSVMLAGFACLAKLAVPPACVYLLSSQHGPADHCETAHLSHGRGSAGEFLPTPAPPYAMGAAAEVATVPLAAAVRR